MAGPRRSRTSSAQRRPTARSRAYAGTTSAPDVLTKVGDRLGVPYRTHGHILSRQ